MRKFSSFIGGRVVKTGIAVFLTALICQWLHWPAVFAVITAIANIEPTARDSIKKSLVRFPASAIGAAYAVIFIALFGNSPISYTAAAVLTIITCYKLNLHAGLLVATLTSVAMIEVIQSNFFASFFIRLGTTTTGLVVSTLVNIFIFPPQYGTKITMNLLSLREKMREALVAVMNIILNGHKDNGQTEAIFADLTANLEKTERLLQFQEAEWQYHRYTEAERKNFYREKELLHAIRQIHYHLSNLLDISKEKVNWEPAEKEQLKRITTFIMKAIEYPHKMQLDAYRDQIVQLTQILQPPNRDYKEEQNFFTPKWFVIYEWIFIYTLVVNFHTIIHADDKE